MSRAENYHGFITIITMLLPSLQQQQNAVPFIETPHWREAYHAPKIQEVSALVSELRALKRDMLAATVRKSALAIDWSGAETPEAVECDLIAGNIMRLEHQIIETLLR